MPQQGFTQFLPMALSMRFAAVNSAHDLLSQSVGFRGVFRFDHPFCEFPQFFAGQLTLVRELIHKLNDAGLFGRRQIS